jgi:Protein of unknown function (DUF3467)
MNDDRTTGRSSVGSRSSSASRPMEGHYANFFQIGHNAFDVLIEFGQQQVGIHTRIYLSPQHARILSDMLSNPSAGADLRRALQVAVGITLPDSIAPSARHPQTLSQTTNKSKARDFGAFRPDCLYKKITSVAKARTYQRLSPGK